MSCQAAFLVSRRPAISCGVTRLPPCALSLCSPSNHLQHARCAFPSTVHHPNHPQPNEPPPPQTSASACPIAAAPGSRYSLSPTATPSDGNSRRLPPRALGVFVGFGTGGGSDITIAVVAGNQALLLLLLLLRGLRFIPVLHVFRPCFWLAGTVADATGTCCSVSSAAAADLGTAAATAHAGAVRRFSAEGNVRNVRR